MQSTRILAVLLMFMLGSSQAYAQGVSSTVLVLSSGMMLLAGLTIYVILKIRSSLRNHLDRPAK